MNLIDKNCYQCKAGLLPGHNYSAIVKIARRLFNQISSKTKRRPYIRSAFFNGEKVFLENFWPHLNQKNPRDRFRRLQWLQCAFELIRCSKKKPISIQNDDSDNKILYRFFGKSSAGQFVVQIKDDIRRRQKYFMSCFEYSKK
jgi:hypothetical protein